MEREEFQEYIKGKKKEIDGDYSRGVINDSVRDRLYLLFEETEKRYEEIRVAYLDHQVQLAKLRQTNVKLTDILSEVSLKAKLALFDLECILKELRENMEK